VTSFETQYTIEANASSLDITLQVSIVLVSLSDSVYQKSSEILAIGALPLKGYPPLKAHLADALDSKCA
jgi:hypothetical protein